MKIGLISDIHGNYDGLLRALNLLRGKGVEQIVCAGDLVEGGLAGDAVVGKIQSEALPCVQGNHDYDAALNQFYLQKNAHLYGPRITAGLLQERTLAFLERLPDTLTFEWAGKHLLLAHGTPWDKYTYLYSGSSRQLYQQLFQAVNADIVILGHTHEPMAVQVGEKWVFNPGAVWRNHHDDSRTCAILTLPDCKFEVFDVETGLLVEPERAEIKL